MIHNRHFIHRTFALTAIAVMLTTGTAAALANAQPEPNHGVSIDYAKLDALHIDRSGVVLAVSALVR
jgi:hypothetical protein